MPNRLATETSPYLFQHKDNPVDWYPWGDEAFDLARTQDKPIFLSVGYSACHWCHVMAHESFEDEETAAFLNENFVSIKVDREERPDVDSIYMNAVQALSGSGGWPMSVWLLPDGRPFFGGTYFPPTARHGIPSFRELLQRIADAYANQRAGLERDAGRLTQAINRTVPLGEDNFLPGWELFETVFQKIAASYDAEWGGFGSQPKFPPSMTIDLLFRLYDHFGWQTALDMATHTLDRMMQGGMYDQLGGGFHRYSVDRQWLVPHFEKMLYDNALLIRAYLAAFQITGESKYRRIVEQTIGYVLREIRDSKGGFYSAQDADSDGHEGKYFVWGEDELRRALDGEVNTDLVLDYWGVKQGPNFEGRSILWTPHEEKIIADRYGTSPAALQDEVEKARTLLFAVRDIRVKPGLDDKVLTAWNGLMIQSLAEAGRILRRPDYVSLAEQSATFLLEELREDGRLRRSYKKGATKFNAYLEDYAFVIEGLLALYEATFELQWFTEAQSLTETMVSLFWDNEAGFFDTSADHETLITRPQELTDNAIPSGTSAAVAALVRMAILADRPDWRAKADRIFARMVPAIESYPSAFSYLASQLAFVLSPPHEIALVGEPGADDLNALLEIVNNAYRPAQVVALLQPDQVEAADYILLLANREKRDGVATAYVCENYVCRMPILDPTLLRGELDRTTSV